MHREWNDDNNHDHGDTEVFQLHPKVIICLLLFAFLHNSKFPASIERKEQNKNIVLAGIEPTTSANCAKSLFLLPVSIIKTFIK